MNDKQINFGRAHFLVYSLILFVVIFTISFAVLFTMERRVREVKFEELMEYEKSNVSLEQDLLGNEFKMIIADLNYLKTGLTHYLQDKKTLTEIEEDWQEFTFQRGIYDKIRFIDAKGDEKIRTNLGTGGAYLTPYSQLENKSGEHFFTKTASMDDGGIFISSIELKVDGGVIAVPYRPTMRFCAPMYGQDGDLDGILVLNFIASDLLKNFSDIAKNSDGEMVLLNARGDWLSSGYANRDWNFMFEGRESLTFGYYFEEWRYVPLGTGQKVTENGLFTYSYVDIAAKLRQQISAPDTDIQMGDGRWYIVSYVLKDDAHSHIFYDNFLSLIWDILKDYAIYVGVVITLSAILGLIVFLYMNAYQKTKFYSEYDVLTHVYNRRAGTKKLDEMLSLSERRNQDISICFIDVNGLKQVNDVLGHKTGDELIITVADVIQHSIREYDFVARMGGDEFIIIFSDVDTQTAEIVWSRICSHFEEINSKENRPYIISVSHGIISCGKKKYSSTTDVLIKEADEKMYVEKRIMKQGLNVIRDVNE